MAKVDMNETDTKLKTEIVSLVQYIRRFREEIAHMVRREDDQTRFESMSDQLDEIVGATERATNSILESVEAIDSVVDDLRAADTDEKRTALCDDISNHTMNAMEACTFQDITGQRVTKIVRSMKFVEERVDILTELWGRDEIEDMAVSIPGEEEERSGDEALLNGPALPAETSISQDDIDKLFD